MQGPRYISLDLTAFNFLVQLNSPANTPSEVPKRISANPKELIRMLQRPSTSLIASLEYRIEATNTPLCANCTEPSLEAASRWIEALSPVRLLVKLPCIFSIM